MIKFFDIYKQDKQFLKKNLNEIKKIIKKTNFINGSEVNKFEKNFAKFCNTKYAISCNSGTDALFFALKALKLKKNDEVIMPAQTYCSTIFAILRAGLKPKLVDIKKNNPTICTDDLQKKITQKTKAIILVHLYGECCDVNKIKKIIGKKKIFIIEDAAQAHGSFIYLNGKKLVAGSMGDIGCFSFYPGKNLGAYGDGGAITTKNKNYYTEILKLRNLGGIKKYEHDILGYNSRLDTIQACVLINKLKYLNQNNNKRKKVASFYKKNIVNSKIEHLSYSKGCVYHQYVILSKKEKRIKQLLEKNKIQYGKHYPIPIHKLPAVKKLFKNKFFPNSEKFSRFGISLPIDPNLQKHDLIRICKVLNSV